MEKLDDAAGIVLGALHLSDLPAQVSRRLLVDYAPGLHCCPKAGRKELSPSTVAKGEAEQEAESVNNLCSCGVLEDRHERPSADARHDRAGCAERPLS
jgi:hypothetical protein